MRPQLSHRSKIYALRSEIVERVVNGRVDGNKALSQFG